MNDKKDPPIHEQQYIAGVNKIIDFGDIRVSRGLSRRPPSTCKHRALVYDSSERRIWCKDCENNVESFDAFKGIVEQFHNAHSDLDRKREEVKQSVEHNIHLMACKNLEKIWRGRRMAPCCPHCSGALLPEDLYNTSTISYELEVQRRKAKKP